MGEEIAETEAPKEVATETSEPEPPKDDPPPPPPAEIVTETKEETTEAEEKVQTEDAPAKQEKVSEEAIETSTNSKQVPEPTPEAQETVAPTESSNSES